MTTTEKKYKISAPVGSIIAPSGILTEIQLRQFGASTAPEDVWKHKFEKDPIADVLELFKVGGYIVTEEK